jgi:antitoxin (DNA-binding transcriptional repressor) of toxin-antitoxin stability system
LTYLTNYGYIDHVISKEVMMIVNVSEAKAKLSKLIDMVFHGEKVIIAKNNLPLVELVIHRPGGRRKLGILAGKVTIPEDITAEDPEVIELFYGMQDADHP